MNKLNSKNILVFVGISILILLVVALFSTIRDTGSTITPQYTIKEEPKNTQNSNNDTDMKEPVNTTPVQSTGGKPTQYTTEELTSIEQFKNLRSTLPMDTQNFSMSKFNFSSFKITVTFKDGTAGNKQQLFEQWLTDNNYSEVDRKYFEFAN